MPQRLSAIHTYGLTGLRR